MVAQAVERFTLYAVHLGCESRVCIVGSTAFEQCAGVLSGCPVVGARIVYLRQIVSRHCCRHTIGCHSLEKPGGVIVVAAGIGNIPLVEAGVVCKFRSAFECGESRRCRVVVGEFQPAESRVINNLVARRLVECVEA